MTWMCQEILLKICHTKNQLQVKVAAIIDLLFLWRIHNQALGVSKLEIHVLQ